MTKVSYIGNPKSNTTLFIGKKLIHLLPLLEQQLSCRVFAETGMDIPPSLLEKHQFIFVDNPAFAYAKTLARDLEEEKVDYQKEGQGILIAKSAQIAKDIKLEPHTIIGAKTIIESSCELGAFTQIKHTTIKSGSIIGSHCQIGGRGFNFATQNGQRIELPTLGRVEIGHNCLVNDLVKIAASLADVTKIGDNVQIDSQSYIHHDCQIGANTQIAANLTLGGFVEVGDNSYLGLGSKIRNRVKLGENVFLGMGSVVVSDIEENTLAYGVPAKVKGKR